MPLYNLSDENVFNLKVFLSKLDYSGRNEFYDIRQLHDIMDSLSKPIINDVEKNEHQDNSRKDDV